MKNRMKGQSCISETFEFGEVRYGTHCACPLTHRIHAEVAGALTRHANTRFGRNALMCNV